MTNIIGILVGTYVSGAGVAQSGFHTFSYAMETGFEAHVPIIIVNPGTTSKSAGAQVEIFRSTETSKSAGAQVEIFRSTDGGGTYETVGRFAAAFPTAVVASEVQRIAIRLDPGRYLVGVQVGGGVASTYTAQLATAWEITAMA
jgi:hypothetical protein